VATRAIVHVGCGRLSVGAVIPFLHAAFEGSVVFLVQRQSDEWKAFVSEDGGSCYLENEGGFFGSYRVHVLRGPGDVPKQLTESSLLLVPNLSYLTKILDVIARRDTIVSCSLGAGQEELVAPLRATVMWERLLAFENTLGKFPHLGQPVQHVIVDRICWGFGPPSTKLSSIAMIKKALCEPAFASFWVPADCGISLIDTRVRANEYGFGAQTLINEYVSEKHLELLKRRKRALVNATHAILGMLCLRALAERRMDPNRQYLAATQALLEKYFPEWDQALAVYCKMRSAEIALEELPDADAEVWQAKFFENVAETRRAKERFLGTADRLERVMDARELRKELGKLKEHVLAPISCYESSREKLLMIWRLGRPSDADIMVLRDFLMETFTSAIEWAQINSRV
jgi:hypothetical protein